MALTLTTSQPCTYHRRHRPTPTYSELHHVIPRAWQAHGLHGSSGHRPGGQEPLFDPRTVAICRTGHGSVHFWLVRAMRAYQVVYDGTPSSEPSAVLDEAWRIVRANARKEQIVMGKPEMQIARLGMERWQDAGGALIDLCRVGLYGEI